MQVSLQLTHTNSTSNRAKKVMLRDVSLDTALAISAALRGLQGADVEAVIVVDPLPASPKGRTPRAQPARLGWAGWIRGLRLSGPVALA